jgi:hypothetical protein
VLRKFGGGLLVISEILWELLSRRYEMIGRKCSCPNDIIEGGVIASESGMRYNKRT